MDVFDNLLIGLADKFTEEEFEYGYGPNIIEYLLAERPRGVVIIGGEVTQDQVLALNTAKEKALIVGCDLALREDRCEPTIMESTLNVITDLKIEPLKTQAFEESVKKISRFFKPKINRKYEKHIHLIKRLRRII